MKTERPDWLPEPEDDAGREAVEVVHGLAMHLAGLKEDPRAQDFMQFVALGARWARELVDDPNDGPSLHTFYMTFADGTRWLFVPPHPVQPEVPHNIRAAMHLRKIARLLETEEPDPTHKPYPWNDK